MCMKRKLLYLSNAIAIHGGLERILVDKVNWLADNTDFVIHLVTFDQGSHPDAYPLSPNVMHTDLDINFHQQYNFSGVRRILFNHQLHSLFRKRLKAAVLDILPDVIICMQQQFVKDVNTIRGDIPLIFECHSAYQAGRFENFSFLQKIQLKCHDRDIKKAQKVIALTRGDAMEWQKVNANVEVIPNMVHLNETGRYSDCSQKSVIFVGRYAVQKDIGSLLKIWQIVNKRHPDWQLHLYGGYGGQSKEEFQSVNLQDINAFSHDATPNIFDKYLESSMLLLTSIHEPFGLVLVEAMSCGLPVVSFNCPYGPADIITEGVDGFLIDGRNVDAFANRVCQLIENVELRQKMGKAAILSSERYRDNIIMPIWVNLFKDLMYGKD